MMTQSKAALTAPMDANFAKIRALVPYVNLDID